MQLFQPRGQRSGRLWVGLSFVLAAAHSFGASANEIADRGRALAFARDKGNCLACHVIAGGTQMGNIGPPIVNVRIRYPDRQGLREQIWDASRFNDNSLMPPFGRHEILSSQEIDAIVAFLYTLE